VGAQLELVQKELAERTLASEHEALAAALEACGDHFTFCPRCGSEGKRSTIVGEYREMMWRDGGVAPPKAAIAGRRPMLPREGRVSQAQL